MNGDEYFYEYDDEMDDSDENDYYEGNHFNSNIITIVIKIMICVENNEKYDPIE